MRSDRRAIISEPDPMRGSIPRQLTCRSLKFRAADPGLPTILISPDRPLVRDAFMVRVVASGLPFWTVPPGRVSYPSCFWRGPTTAGYLHSRLLIRRTCLHFLSTPFFEPRSRQVAGLDSFCFPSRPCRVGWFLGSVSWKALDMRAIVAMFFSSAGEAVDETRRRTGW